MINICCLQIYKAVLLVAYQQSFEMSDRRHSYNEAKLNSNDMDTPPNSRLFVIGSKQLSEDDFREAFSKFGEIEEIWLVKDRATGERKGFTYVKFSKTSEAAKALEALNGKVIGNTNRHIKIIIASRKEQGSRREENEEERSQRLFVLIPKTMTENDMREYFKQFGDIDTITIIRDRETKENKGFAYVKYFKFSHAAIAYEQCDKRYKAVFAEPRSNKRNSTNDYTDPNINNSYETFNNKTSSTMLPLPDIPSEGYTKLKVIASVSLNQDQLWKLFDIVPGMDYLRTDERFPPRGTTAAVVYSHPQWAAYAREKFHGFEYPPGSRLIVKPDFDGARTFPERNRTDTTINLAQSPDIKQLAETIAQATSIIQAAGISTEFLQNKLGFVNKKEDYCTVELPEVQPLLHVDDTVEARCFFVCSPHPPNSATLKDVFCRFGNLIEVYVLQNRNCGYAKYGRKESAENAIKTLHGAEVTGIRLKVFEAEEKDNQRKRLKLDSWTAD